MKIPPKYIWGNYINLCGLAWSSPKRFQWNSELSSWYYRRDWSIDKLGLYYTDGYVTFSSTSLHDVKTWTSGASCVLKELNRYTKVN